MYNNIFKKKLYTPSKLTFAIFFFKKISEFLLDTFFPIRCLICKKEKSWLCDDCLSKIELRTEHFCPACEKVNTPDGLTCIPCKRKFALDGLLVATSYKDALVSKAIHFFKYRFLASLDVSLGKLLTQAFSKTTLPLPDLIIPVPLHPKRLRWRGFNQSQLLAEYFSKNLLPGFEIEVSTNLLARVRYTQPQMQIKNQKQRHSNIKDAFAVTTKDSVQGKTILLIDDVATTGSTIFECAKILKKAGASEVYAIVIARQGYTNS